MRRAASSSTRRRQYTAGGNVPTVNLMIATRYPCHGRSTWRRAALPVHLSGVYRVRPRDPVQEQQASAVVQFVLDGAGLERIGSDLRLTAAGHLARYDQPSGPLHVTGQVR